MKKRKGRRRQAETSTEHDFSGGVRGKYASRYAAGSKEALRSLNVMARRRRGKAS